MRCFPVPAVSRFYFFRVLTPFLVQSPERRETNSDDSQFLEYLDELAEELQMSGDSSAEGPCLDSSFERDRETPIAEQRSSETCDEVEKDVAHDVGAAVVERAKSENPAKSKKSDYLLERSENILNNKNNDRNSTKTKTAEIKKISDAEKKKSTETDSDRTRMSQKSESEVETALPKESKHTKTAKNKTTSKSDQAKTKEFNGKKLSGSTAVKKNMKKKDDSEGVRKNQKPKGKKENLDKKGSKEIESETRKPVAQMAKTKRALPAKQFKISNEVDSGTADLSTNSEESSIEEPPAKKVKTGSRKTATATSAKKSLGTGKNLPKNARAASSKKELLGSAQLARDEDAGKIVSTSNSSNQRYQTFFSLIDPFGFKNTCSNHATKHEKMLQRIVNITDPRSCVLVMCTCASCFEKSVPRDKKASPSPSKMSLLRTNYNKCVSRCDPISGTGKTKSVPSYPLRKHISTAFGIPSNTILNAYTCKVDCSIVDALPADNKAVSKITPDGNAPAQSECIFDSVSVGKKQLALLLRRGCDPTDSASYILVPAFMAEIVLGLKMSTSTQSKEAKKGAKFNAVNPIVDLTPILDQEKIQKRFVLHCTESLGFDYKDSQQSYDGVDKDTRGKKISLFAEISQKLTATHWNVTKIAIRSKMVSNENKSYTKYLSDLSDAGDETAKPQKAFTMVDDKMWAFRDCCDFFHTVVKRVPGYGTGSLAEYLVEKSPVNKRGSAKSTGRKRTFDESIDDDNSDRKPAKKIKLFENDKIGEMLFQKVESVSKILETLNFFVKASENEKSNANSMAMVMEENQKAFKTILENFEKKLENMDQTIETLTDKLKNAENAALRRSREPGNFERRDNPGTPTSEYVENIIRNSDRFLERGRSEEQMVYLTKNRPLGKSVDSGSDEIREREVGGCDSAESSKDASAESSKDAIEDLSGEDSAKNDSNEFTPSATKNASAGKKLGLQFMPKAAVAIAFDGCAETTQAPENTDPKITQGKNAVSSLHLQTVGNRLGRSAQSSPISVEKTKRNVSPASGPASNFGDLFSRFQKSK